MAKPLSPAQLRLLSIIDRAPASAPAIGFRADPTVRALLARGLIAFAPTAFGAGYVRRAARRAG